MRGKHGISAIVATVLIILITVVAVTVIWVTIIPMIGDDALFDDFDVRLEIVTQGGYTFWDEDVGVLYIQVSRGADDVNMTGLRFVVTVGGNSIIYPNNPNFPGNAYIAPEVNGKRSYIIAGISEKPDSVKVISLIGDGSIEEEGSFVGVSNNIGKGSSSSGGDSGTDTREGSVGSCNTGRVHYEGSCAIEVTDCMSDFIEGETYLLTQSIPDVDGDCFIIGVDNMVLDLGGYRITGDGGTSIFGILSNNRNGVTVKNGEIYNFDYGISFSNGLNHIIEDITVSSSVSNGISFFNIHNSELTNIVSEFTGHGAVNDDHGIYLHASSSGNQLTNIVSRENDGDGIKILGGVNNVLTNVVANSNQGFGVNLDTDFGNNVIDSTLCDNVFSDLKLHFSTINPCYGDGNTFGVVSGNCQGWPGTPGDGAGFNYTTAC